MNDRQDGDVIRTEQEMLDQFARDMIDMDKCTNYRRRGDVCGLCRPNRPAGGSDRPVDWWSGSVPVLLAHHLGGSPAQSDVEHADIPARTPDGESATMCRWVLREHVWTKLLDDAGFTRISGDLLPAGPGPRAADTLLLTARRGPMS